MTDKLLATAIGVGIGFTTTLSLCSFKPPKLGLWLAVGVSLSLGILGYLAGREISRW